MPSTTLWAIPIRSIWDIAASKSTRATTGSGSTLATTAATSSRSTTA